VGGWLAGAAAQAHFIDVEVVRRYLFSPLILKGLKATVVLALLAQGTGIAIGILVAVMRLAKNPVLTGLASFYVWFFRGTPVLVQLFFWFNGVPSVFKTLTIAVPFTHITLYSTPMVEFMTPFMAAFLGFSLNEGAYMAEIVRGGILSVDEGQIDAAQALGMTSTLTLRRIVLPQAFRTVISPLGSLTIAMIKNSAIIGVSLLALPDLLKQARIVQARTFQTDEAFFWAAVGYLLLTGAVTLAIRNLERRFAIRR
jgi:polar amino acid transport system permease protein